VGPPWPAPGCPLVHFPCSGMWDRIRKTRKQVGKVKDGLLNE